MRDGGAVRSGLSRRTVLAQERSKATRRLLIRAAVQLWSERGFGEGVENTTVEEIVARAGVSKRTFYFHFAHKEDIFLELGWAMGEMLYQEAVREAVGRRSGLALLNHLMRQLALRVEATPRAAVMRSATSFYGRAYSRLPEDRAAPDALAVALRHAVETGELPEEVDVEELAGMLNALVTDACLRWACGDKRPLSAEFRTRARIVLAGARSVAATGGPTEIPSAGTAG